MIAVLPCWTPCFTLESCDTHNQDEIYYIPEVTSYNMKPFKILIYCYKPLIFFNKSCEYMKEKKWYTFDDTGSNGTLKG